MPSGRSEPDVVFVCGSMRSGTTLLQKLICTSLDANHSINPCRYLTEHVQVYAKYSSVDQVYIDDYLGNKEGLQRFTRDTLERLLAETWRATGQPKILILKNPELSFFVPLLQRELLPRARFIFSIREPKDTISSMIKVGERLRQSGKDGPLARTGRDIEALCTMYSAHYSPVLKALAQGDSPLRPQVTFARYEDVVSRTEPINKQIAQFCGITPGKPPEDGKWRTGANESRLAEHPKWRNYVTELSRQAISGASIGAHRSLLSPEECAKIDERCRGLRERFGYTRSEGGSGR